MFHLVSYLSRIFMGCKRTLRNPSQPSVIYTDFPRLRTKLVHLPILDGQTLIVVPRWDTEVCLKVIQRYKVTMILLVPPVALALASGTSAIPRMLCCFTFFNLSEDPLVDKYDVSSIKYVISGAAPLGSELQERLRNRLDCYVTQAYGMTESSPTSHYAPYDRPRLGSCGPSLPNVQTRIVDPVTMKDMPNIGDEGELWMKVDRRLCCSAYKADSMT